MRLAPPFPKLNEMMALVGEAGHRLAEIEASEGAAGNISVYLGWNVDPEPYFPVSEPFMMPEPSPEMAGHGFLVTGSGRRLREIASAPQANLGFLHVDEGGRTGRLYTSPERMFQRPTSEFNSHLAVHRHHIGQHNLNFHAVVHAQPLHLVYLSHISRYQDSRYMNRHILRWQPETIVNIPEGVGVLPFLLPSSQELMEATVNVMAKHRMVLWGKHGVMVRSDTSVKRCCDLIEYAETGARYEYLNLTNHGLADGLTPDQIRRICETFHVDQTIF